MLSDDGSSFAGNSAWGNTSRSTYYYNNANKIRVRSEVFDSAAEKILRQVTENSPEFQKSVADYAVRKENSIGMLSQKIAEIDTRLGELESERQRLDKRLSFLLDDDDVAMAQSFRGEYKRQRKKDQLQLLLKHFKETQEGRHSWLEQVNKALGYIRKKDLVSLRSTYRRIFDKIIVQRLDEAKVKLQFVFKNLTSPSYMGEVLDCISVHRVEFEHQETNFLLNPKILIKSTTCITYSLIPEALLIQKYLENRLSLLDIANEFSCSKSRVRDLLIKFNIPRRQSSDYRGSRWFAYGRRRVGSKTADHRGEQKTIAAIRKMYAEGINTVAIARCLNAMKVPTKRQG